MNPSKWFRGVSPRTFRRGMRLFPPIRNTGVLVDRISDDWLEWDLRLPLGLKTRNYVGTHYGGTLYSAADPHFMLAFMHLMPDVIVWDKAATIRFKRPGRGTLRGRIRIDADEVGSIRRQLDQEPRFDRTYHFTWTDADGTVVAEVDKVLHFRHGHQGGGY